LLNHSQECPLLNHSHGENIEKYHEEKEKKLICCFLQKQTTHSRMLKCPILSYSKNTRFCQAKPELEAYDLATCIWMDHCYYWIIITLVIIIYSSSIILSLTIANHLGWYIVKQYQDITKFNEKVFGNGSDEEAEEEEEEEAEAEAEAEEEEEEEEEEEDNDDDEEDNNEWAQK